MVTNHAGAELSRVLYKPFGEAPAGTPPRFGFTGQRFEAGLGIYDYGARFYDPGLGRFLSADSIVPQPANPQSLNRYSYAKNNPLARIDPSGNYDVGFDFGFGLDSWMYTDPWDPFGSTSAYDPWGAAWDPFGFGASYSYDPWGSFGYAGLGFNPFDPFYGGAGSGGWGSLALSGFQGLLDLSSIALDYTGIGGLVSWIPDLANAGISYWRGDSFGAGASLAGAIPFVGIVANLGRLGRAAGSGLDLVDEVADASRAVPDVPYQRPSGATTRAQREAVQGQPCVDCGIVPERAVADHRTPLVMEYYETGRIDMDHARSLDAVQPQCPTCSARQGAELSRYSREQRRRLGLE